MGHSRPFRRGCDPLNFFFLPFKYVMNDPEQMTYTINSLMKKKLFETNFIMSRALF